MEFVASKIQTWSKLHIRNMAADKLLKQIPDICGLVFIFESFITVFMNLEEEVQEFNI